MTQIHGDSRNNPYLEKHDNDYDMTTQNASNVDIFIKMKEQLNNIEKSYA